MAFGYDASNPSGSKPRPAKEGPMTAGRGRGRPTAYRDEYVDQGYKLALLGLTDAEIAAFFEVHEDTINEWKSAHPEFSVSIQKGKLPADSNVAASMYHRAKGYSHEAVKIFMPTGATEPVYAPYTEHYPPDTQAASLWLRNRQPKLWRDKQEHEHSGSLTLEQLVLKSMEPKA